MKHRKINAAWGLAVWVEVKEERRESVEEGNEKLFSLGNKQYRDSVFCHYFKDKVRLLSLCNAILDTDYKDIADLTITTLPGTFFNAQKNDISCKLGDRFLVLVEHQTTVNDNMPFRCLSYVTELLNNLIEDKRKLYRHKLIMFPVPEFVVLYNGKEDEPLKKEMRLSDAFGGDRHSIELVVTAYNINYGLEQPLLEKCIYLHDYSFFVGKVKAGVGEGKAIDEAITNAVKYCIENGVMKDYLEENAKEVFTLTRMEWNIDDAKVAWEEEAWEGGRNEGRNEGILFSIKTLMKSMNLSLEKAMDALQISGDDRKKYAELMGV